MKSSNVSIITDEDGEYPDWIELYNNNTILSNLNGIYISDDSSDIFKWKLPNIIIQPQDHLLLFASEKHRKVCANYWETIINWSCVWRWRLLNNNFSNDFTISL